MTTKDKELNRYKSALQRISLAIGNLPAVPRASDLDGFDAILTYCHSEADKALALRCPACDGTLLDSSGANDCQNCGGNPPHGHPKHDCDCEDPREVGYPR